MRQPNRNLRLEIYLVAAQLGMHVGEPEHGGTDGTRA